MLSILNLNKNTMKKIILSFLALSTLAITSCSNDDDSSSIFDNGVTKTVADIDLDGLTLPESYDFSKDGQTTVSYGGQTTRTLMAKELISGLKETSNTSAILKDDMFTNGIGFSDVSLNDSDKKLRNKTAASDDFFPGSDASIEGRAVRDGFDDLILDQTGNVFVAWGDIAEAGKPGQIADGSSVRYVNEFGIENDQVFAKGLIGALQVDQALNNYMSRVENDDNEVLEEGKNYTEMEHHFDEAYGYLLNEEDTSFFGKYLPKVDSNPTFTGIEAQINEAFIIARQAIVEKKYAVRDQAIEVLRYQVSRVIAIRSIYYLQAGKVALNNQDFGGAFHDLSEGLGFVKSLRFTRKADANESYFTQDEVDGFSQLMETGNGLWSITPETLDDISEDIAAKFDFTVAEASL
jgi:hypothetical protein